MPPHVSLPPEVARVAAELAALGCAGVPEPRDIVQTRVATRPGEHITKTQVFTADGAFVLVVVSTDHRADPINLAGVLGATDVVPAGDHQIRRRTGHHPADVAPIGSGDPLPVILDIDLAHYQRIWVPAGHPDWLFPTSYAELLRITAGIAAEVGDLPSAQTPPTMQK